ncbi:MAG: TonB-dependent receptor [Candidatus Zixiibacteriota bacterium]|nr:MAG: TonB-dependent receptor [candidate division Zixibacteria bacterium]
MQFSRKQRLLLCLLLMGLTPLAATNVDAAATGKIIGQLLDAQTKEPVVGASVMVVGTRRGAMTDLDGRYEIFQMEPGTYELRITHLDYVVTTITEVTVKSDITTEMSQDLKRKDATELDIEITVKGEQDILKIYEVSNEVTISKEAIEQQPVSTVDDLLTQVTGVVTNQQGEVFIRGGRAFEVAYVVDGVPLGDPLGGLGQAGANLSLVSGSIQEFTVIKDGFDPEYGDALSGIVKITTQTGQKDVTRMNFKYSTDDFGNRDLNKYSRNSDFMRFSISGPDPILRSKILPALGLNFLEDKELTYYFYAEMDKDDGYWQYSRYDTPITQRSISSFNMLGFPVPERDYNKYYWMANIKFRPTQNLKLLFSYKDRVIKSYYFDWTFRYTSATAPVRETTWRSASLEVSQSISKDMNYEVVLSYAENGLTQKPGDPNNPGEGLDPDQFNFDYEWESFLDRNGNGVYDPPEPIVNLFPDTTDYGTDFFGPDYTYGEQDLMDINVQGATTDTSDFRFNDNYYLDNIEGEPFVDLNGNGVWDEGDYLYDKNGNGVLDEELLRNVDQSTVEPYIDGDSVLGEPFIDVNANNVYDAGVDIFVMGVGEDNMDLNHDGRYNGPAEPWEPGIPYIDRNGNGLYDAPNHGYDTGEPFTDVNGNGVWDGGGASTFFDPVTFSDTAVWHHRNTDTYRGEVKLFWQLGNHELKGGFAIKQEDFIYQEIHRPYMRYTGRPDGGPYPDRGAFRDMFSYDPWSGTFYFRDKLEYGSMIASLGFRWDFFLQDKDDLVDVARNDDLGSGIILGDRQKLSPRIGFSYPISDKAKVHFNYGHFFQRPSLLYMYKRNTTSVTMNTAIGNYNLDYQKTIQYSFGVKYAMSENYSIDLSGYFKDEFDKINAASVRVGGLRRTQFRNSDYGRSRGFEFTVEKRGGGYVNGLVSYVYSFAFGKASQTNENYMTDFENSRVPLDEAPLMNDVRHNLKASVQIFVPTTAKPRLFGLPIANGWTLAVQSLVESGRPFTPDRNYPNINTDLGESIQRNSMRKPWLIYFDVRFTKDFNLFGLDNKFILEVENVFDNKNIVWVFPNTGRPDTGQNDGTYVHGGTAFDNDPRNYDYGRQITMGVEVTL